MLQYYKCHLISRKEFKDLNKLADKLYSEYKKLDEEGVLIKREAETLKDKASFLDSYRELNKYGDEILKHYEEAVSNFDYTTKMESKFKGIVTDLNKAGQEGSCFKNYAKAINLFKKPIKELSSIINKSKQELAKSQKGLNELGIIYRKLNWGRPYKSS